MSNVVNIETAITDRYKIKEQDNELIIKGKLQIIDEDAINK